MRLHTRARRTRARRTRARRTRARRTRARRTRGGVKPKLEKFPIPNITNQSVGLPQHPKKPWYLQDLPSQLTKSTFSNNRAIPAGPLRGVHRKM